MRLTRKENEMLEGKYGYAVQKSMEILVSLGECYDAKKMISATSSHLLNSLSSIGKGGALFIQEMADQGGKFIILSTTNPSNVDPSWRNLGVSKKFVQEQTYLTRAFAQMNVFLSDTCTPYLVGHVPRFSEHVAWNESSAVIFANSVLGARTNREGGPSALAAALTGRVPEYGYHLDQNRYGDLRILVTARLRDLHDYGTLGYFVGEIAKDKVPVLIGIPPSVSLDELKLLGAAAATSGSVTLYHAVGVTPEAPTEKAAFGGRKIKGLQTVEFGTRELRETERLISTAKAKEVDLVILGCPHASIGELREIARYLSGKRLNSEVECWISTSRMVKTYADAMGYKRLIEESGAKLICNTCPVSLYRISSRNAGSRIAATNSAKMVYAFPHGRDVLIYYGSLERCINAAMSGVWR